MKASQTVTSCDQVGDAAALEESREFAARVEDVHELDHLHQTQSDDGGFCVVSEAETVDESSAASDDVLQRTANLDGVDVVADDNAEVWCLEQIAQDRRHLLVLDADGGFAELLVGDFVGQVSAHQHGARNLNLVGALGESFDLHETHLKMLRDDVGNQLDAATFGNVEALDQGQTDGARLDLSNHLSPEALDELMRDHEDEDVGVLSRFDDIGNGNLCAVNMKQVLDCQQKYRKRFSRCWQRVKSR